MGSLGGEGREKVFWKMGTFIHGLRFYCLYNFVLCSTVCAFAAVPDISRFQNLRKQLVQTEGPFYFPEKELLKLGSSHPLGAHLTPQYGKAAQSNGRLAFLRNVRNALQSDNGNPKYEQLQDNMDMVRR